MANDNHTDESRRPHKWVNKGGHGPGPTYLLGLIGALVYYLQTASTFWMGIAGILKALVWPAFLVYHLLQFMRV